MAEALAIVGLVSAVVQFMDFSTKIVKRLDEFQSSIDHVPKSFQAIKSELPLFLYTLRRTKEQAEAGYVDEDTQHALLQVVEDCRLHANLLNDTLVKMLPNPEDRKLRRMMKAFQSVLQEKKIQEIIARLRNHIQTLTYHHATGVSKLEPKPKVTAMWLVPFDQNKNFVGREEIFEALEKAFAVGNDSQPRAALCGLGGVG
jgi:hypothetical protein